MAKKIFIMSIIEDCWQCQFNMRGKCWKNSDAGRQFSDEEIESMAIHEIYFPEWCPLEDYNGNENE